MNIKKFYFTIFIDFCFLVACISFSISCFLEFSLNTLIPGIMTGLCFIILLIVQILSLTDFNRHLYFISYNHKYYLEGVDIFENSIYKNKCRILFVGKKTKSKLTGTVGKVLCNNNLGIKFEVYEAHDNFQLIVFKANELRKNNHWFEYEDYESNVNLLIQKTGIIEFSGELGIERYYTNDKKNVITINKSQDTYSTCEFKYSIGWCWNAKFVFSTMIPHWISNRDGLNWEYNTLEEARTYAIEELNRLNESYSLSGKTHHYFILEKERFGTAYHEFQTGNKKGVYWDKTSILLSEDIMEDSHINVLFERIIPNYDYYGNSVVNRETWNLLKEESKNESEKIQEIIQEMVPWAERSIETFNCFTIKGI